MLALLGLTVGLLAGVGILSAFMRREEIQQNWSKYKSDPFFMFAAFMFKPDDDPRSRIKFMTDNFSDAINDMLNTVFAVFLEPVFKIFNVFAGSLTQILSGLFNIRELLGTMWHRWRKITDVFMRRFQITFHSLRMTFIKLFDAMGKSYGVAVSAVFQGLSTISTIMSFFDLMIKICITILIILVVLTIFLFFILWPVIPIILIAVAVISMSAFGGAVGGMASTFCFAEGTAVLTATGPVPIEEIRLNTKLSTGATVDGVMYFEQTANDMYDLHGVKVSADHIVFDEKGVPCHVCEHPAARPDKGNIRKLYCLITSDRKIPVQTAVGPMLFADWEEIAQDEAAQTEWYETAYSMLNGTRPTAAPRPEALQSEAVVSERTRIWTPLGPAEIRGIRPGDKVLDADGNIVSVRGVVMVSGSQVTASTALNSDAEISAGAWWLRDGIWSQPVSTCDAPASSVWYSLFTETGTYRLCEANAIGIPVRDFTDVGPTKISETYDMVLEHLFSATRAKKYE